MKRICIFIILSFLCGSAMSQNPVKVKTSDLIPMVKEIGLDSTMRFVYYDIYLIDTVVAKQLLEYVDKDDEYSQGYQFYKYLQREWLEVEPVPTDPDIEKENEEFITLTRKYNSLGDIDFSKEPNFVKWSKEFNWYDTLLYNEKVGLWTLARSDKYSSWSYNYMIELINGNKLRFMPLYITHGSRHRE